MVKSLMMGVLGLLLGTVGMDPISGQIRFALGTRALMDGIDLALVAMGLFGLAEALTLIGGETTSRELIETKKLREVLPTRGVSFILSWSNFALSGTPTEATRKLRYSAASDRTLS